MESLIQSPLVILRFFVLVVGLAISLSRSGKAQKIITGGVVLSPVVLFLSLLAGSILPYWIALAALLTGVLMYAIRKQELSVAERICIAVMGPAFHLRYLTELLHLPTWPFDLLRAGSVVLFIYVLASARFKKIPPETGFLFIWSLLIILDFVEYFAFGAQRPFYSR